MTVEELGQRMSAAEFEAHWSDAQLAPFDMELVVLMIAQLTALIANVHRNDKTKPKPFTASDFLPACAPVPDAPATAADVEAFLAELKCRP